MCPGYPAKPTHGAGRYCGSHTRLCDTSYGVRLTDDGQDVERWGSAPLQSDAPAVEPCTFEADSAKAWLKKIHGTPQSWEECHTLFRVKQGGDPYRTKVGHETYVERLQHRNGPDAYAIKYHATNIITFEPDGRIILKTNGWYTVNTSKRMRAYTPDGVKIWSDGNCRGTIRWYVSTEQSRRREGPSSYEKLVENFVIGPRGGIKGQDGREASHKKTSGTRNWGRGSRW